ncbi:hypothetical protein [Streptomyces sp. WMMB303]|uniref:hypothetical protein n=1 Tax=Streptomyces sp. WMMB303 TaxID=3034154 RepID=UPI0023EAB597|nr:hypothetical protein [Streptomyces sp. WMMB303]MDF4250395.1 hypothetical protein [Streptomyces sp. WMMB303]
MTGSDKSAGSAARRRRGLAVLLGIAVLAGAGLGTRATETWPFDRQSYCWGAWEVREGDRVPHVLDELPEDEERSGEQSAPPRKGRRATCSVTLRDTSGSGYDERIEAEVATVPRGSKERRDWLRTYLDADSAPLPDGLPGLVGRARAVFVLPEKCDSADGLPTAVTVEGARTSPLAASMGTEEEVADLLLSLAGTAAHASGCAPEEPFEAVSPLARADADDSLTAQGAELCRIPGLRFDLDKDDHYDAGVGAVRDDLQTCSVLDTADVRNPVRAALFAAVSRPRLTALFTGLAGDGPPGEGWRGTGEVGEEHGVLTATCAGRPTVFFLQLDAFLAAQADPDPRRVFAAAANSVADRLGCPAVAPRS